MGPDFRRETEATGVRNARNLTRLVAGCLLRKASAPLDMTCGEDYTAPIAGANNSVATTPHAGLDAGRALVMPVAEGICYQPHLSLADEQARDGVFLAFQYPVEILTVLLVTCAPSTPGGANGEMWWTEAVLRDARKLAFSNR